MITIPGNVRVWLATGHTDMRRGFPSLARLVQEGRQHSPVNRVGSIGLSIGLRSSLDAKAEHLAVQIKSTVDRAIPDPLDRWI